MIKPSSSEAKSSSTVAVPEMFNVIAVSNGLTLLRVAVKATELSVPSVTVPPVDQVTAVSSSSIRSIDKVF